MLLLSLRLIYRITLVSNQFLSTFVLTYRVHARRIAARYRYVIVVVSASNHEKSVKKAIPDGKQSH